MALQGDLTDFPLTDIIQLLALSKKNGAVRIIGRRNDGEHEGWLYFRDGHIVDARLGRFTPLEAAYSLFTFSAGSFEFMEHVRSANTSITASNEVIIMEGINRQDTWMQIEAALPPMNMVPQIASNPAASNDDIEIGGDVWRILTMIDGTRSIADLAEQSGLGEVYTAEIVVKLLQAGLIAEQTESPADTLFPVFEQIVSGSLGSQAVLLLNECYRLAGIRDRVQATPEQITKALRTFAATAMRLYGQERAASVVAALQHHMQSYSAVASV